MEPWQKDVIEVNTHKLVELIYPDDGLVANLESSRLLASDELESLKLCKTRGDKVDKLLKFLIMQKGAYEKLYIALKEDRQEAPAEILLEGARDHNPASILR